MNELQTIIDKLRSNKKILSVSIFYIPDAPAYAAIQYLDKYSQEYTILIDVTDMHLLTNKFTITTRGKYSYVKLKDQNKYLHQILLPVEKNSVVHHTSRDFTLDNRRSSLQEVEKISHLLFHKQQSLQ